MPKKSEKDTSSEEPKAVKDTLEDALESVDRTFDGEPIGDQGTGQDEESIMSGHPATEDQEEPEQEPETEPGSEGEEPPAETKEPETRFKYKSHQEAEEAALEGQRQLTQLSTELQETKDLLLKALAGQRTATPKEDEPPKETPENFAKQRRLQALNEIEDLDPDDEDYKEKVASIQAKADADVLRRHEETRDAQSKQQRKQEEENQDVISKAEGAMEEAGLDTSKDSRDVLLFWSLAQIAPQQKNGLPLDLDGQIAWCVHEVSTYKTKSLEEHKVEEARRLADKAQDTEGHLGRGATGPPAQKETPPQAVKPASLRSVIDTVMSSRQI